MAEQMGEDLVYKVSRWQRFLYDEERGYNEGLNRAEAQGSANHARYADYQRELFSRVYNPGTPKLDEPAGGNEWASSLHDLASGMPEFQSLQERCAGDEVWSGMATATLSSTVAAKVAEQMEGKQAPDVEGLQKQVDGLRDLQGKGVKVGDRLAKAEAKLEKAQQEAQAMADGIDPSAIRQAIRQGCAQAQQEVSDAEDSVEAFTFGNQPGAPSQTGIEEKRKLSSKIRDSERLKRLAKISGRLRRIAAEKQRSKASDSREEISDIEQGDDLGRVLASEMTGLVEEDPALQEMLELDFFRRMQEKALLQYKLSGKEKEGQGPIVVVTDVSGSMEGDRDLYSKGTAMAMLDVARRQGRSWAMVQFDSLVSRVDVATKGQIAPDVLMDAMQHFTGGGTNFRPALDEALRIIREEAEFKKADMVVITDGNADTDAAWNEAFGEAKQELEFSVFTVLVQEGSKHVVSAWSDKVFRIEELTEDSFQDVVFSV
jgi:uncharacterized protein with von Willebrand factor type A (vWA) domain